LSAHSTRMRFFGSVRSSEKRRFRSSSEFLRRYASTCTSVENEHPLSISFLTEAVHFSLFEDKTLKVLRSSKSSLLTSKEVERPCDNWYFLKIRNVGLLTTSTTPNAFATACTKVVFPAPRSPYRPTTVARSGKGARPSANSCAVFWNSARL